MRGRIQNGSLHRVIMSLSLIKLINSLRCLASSVGKVSYACEQCEVTDADRGNRDSTITEIAGRVCLQMLTTLQQLQTIEEKLTHAMHSMPYNFDRSPMCFVMKNAALQK